MPIENSRKKLRNQQKANTPDTDYFIKSIRADDKNFVRNFVADTILFNQKTPFNHKTPLRMGNKKHYTVTGNGVFSRIAQVENANVPIKQPQYSAIEKQGFSNFQSTSMGMTDFHPPVFGFNINRALVGVILSNKNVLLSNRLYVYDSGTVSRPYDFDSKQQAEDYYKRNSTQNILFSKAQFESFKTTIKNNGNNAYNEALVRIKGTADDGLRVFIGEDTLAARLLAQEYARIIKSALINANMCDTNYQVPIIYYIPESDLNFKTYVLAEQTIDTNLAKKLVLDDDQFNEHMKEKKYEILLGLEKDEIVKLFQSHKNSFLSNLIKDGYIHILASLLEKCDEDVGILYDIFIQIHNQTNNFIPKLYSHIEKSHDKKSPSITAMMLHLFKEGDINLNYCNSSNLHQYNFSSTYHLNHHYSRALNMETPTLLQNILANNDTEYLKCILKKKKDINTFLMKKFDNEESHFEFAIMNGGTACLELVFQQLKFNNIKNILSQVDNLSLILNKEKVPYLMVLIEKDINKFQRTLEIIVKLYPPESIKDLLTNIKTENGETAFMYAARHTNSVACDLILKQLEDKDKKELLMMQDKDGKTALMHTAQHNHYVTFKLILNQFNDENKKILLKMQDNNGQTTLMYMAKNKKLAACDFILKQFDTEEKKTLLMMKAKNGTMALMYLIANKMSEEIEKNIMSLFDKEWLEILLSCDNYGRSLLSYALQENFKSFNQWLNKFEHSTQIKILTNKVNEQNTLLADILKHSECDQVLAVSLLQKLNEEQRLQFLLENELISSLILSHADLFLPILESFSPSSQKKILNTPHRIFSDDYTYPLIALTQSINNNKLLSVLRLFDLKDKKNLLIQQDSEGKTVLMYLIENYRQSELDYILQPFTSKDKRSLLSQKDNKGKTALIYAGCNLNMNILKFLLSGDMIPLSEIKQCLEQHTTKLKDDAKEIIQTYYNVKSYMQERKTGSTYKNPVGILFGYGFNKDQKLEAAQAFLDNLLTGKEIHKQHKPILSDGILAQRTKYNMPKCVVKKNSPYNYYS